MVSECTHPYIHNAQVFILIPPSSPGVDININVVSSIFDGPAQHLCIYFPHNTTSLPESPTRRVVVKEKARGKATRHSQQLMPWTPRRASELRRRWTSLVHRSPSQGPDNLGQARAQAHAPDRSGSSKSTRTTNYLNLYGAGGWEKLIDLSQNGFGMHAFLLHDAVVYYTHPPVHPLGKTND